MYHISKIYPHSWLNCIPLYVIFCLSFHLLMNSWVVSTFWLLWVMLVWTSMYRYLFQFMLSILLDMYLWGELLGHLLFLYLTFEESPNHFPQWLCHFTFLPGTHKGFNFSKSSSALIFCFLNILLFLFSPSWKVWSKTSLQFWGILRRKRFWIKLLYQVTSVMKYIEINLSAK